MSRVTGPTMIRRRGFRRWQGALAAAACLATIVAAVYTVLAFHQSPGPAEAGQAGGDPTLSPPGATGTPPSTGPPPRPDPITTYLATLRPVAGGARLAALPDTLRDHDDFAGSVVIACPSNQSGDQSSEVTYETRGRYRDLEATLHPYYEPRDDILMSLEVFPDLPDHAPDTTAGHAPDTVQLRVGQEERPVSFRIEDAYYLRLRVRCEKPGGYLILGGALLRSQS